MTQFEYNAKVYLVNALLVERNVPGFAFELCWVRLSPLQLLCVTLLMGSVQVFCVGVFALGFGFGCIKLK